MFIEVVLQTVIVTREQTGTKCCFKHVARKLYCIADFQSTGGLEHLNIDVLAGHFNHLCHQFCVSYCDIADFVLCYRSIDYYSHEVRDDTFNFSCCHILL